MYAPPLGGAYYSLRWSYIHAAGSNQPPKRWLNEYQPTP